MADKFKFAVAAIFLISGIVVFRLLPEDVNGIFKLLAVLVGIAIAAGISYTTQQGKQFSTFVKEAITETKKVVWPTRKETIQTTLVVFGFVLIMAIFLYLTDKTLEWVLYDLILGWRK